MFKRHFLISAFIHFTAVAGLLIANDILVINIDVKQGLSSLSVNFKEAGDNSGDVDMVEKSRPLQKRKFSVIVSPAGSFNFTDDREKYKSEIKKRTDSKKQVGALSERGSINSRNSPPEYPYVARKLKYEGRVTLGIEVLPNGRTGRVRVIKSSGREVLDLSAVRAARQWIFFKEGEMDITAPVEITQEILFSLR